MAERLERGTRPSAFTPTSIAIVVVAVFLAFVLRDAFETAHTVIGWVVACSIVAMLVDPLVGRVDRFLPRWLSVILVLLALVVVVAGVALGLANDVVTSLEELEAAAPEAAASLEERFGWAADVGLEDRVRTFIDDLRAQVRSDALSFASESVPTYFVTGILMLFILGYGRRYVASFIDQFDAARRPRMRQVISGASRRSERYLLITLAHGVVNGALAWLVFNSIDLRAALSLSVAVGVFTLLPLVGVLLGGLPAILLAFGLDGWPAGLIVLSALVVLQVIEAVLVRPRVDTATVRLGPTVPVIVALLGFELYGIGGAVYGVALAVVGLAFLDQLGAPAQLPIASSPSGSSPEQPQISAT